MFRTVPLSIVRSFSQYTQQWYMSYRFADSLRAGSGRNSVLILLARNCPKHVEFYSKNKCEKLVHLFGFIIRIQAPGLFLVLYGNSNVLLLESGCVRPHWHCCCHLVSFDAVRWPLQVNLLMFVILFLCYLTLKTRRARRFE